MTKRRNSTREAELSEALRRIRWRVLYFLRQWPAPADAKYFSRAEINPFYPSATFLEYRRLRRTEFRTALLRLREALKSRDATEASLWMYRAVQIEAILEYERLKQPLVLRALLSETRRSNQRRGVLAADVRAALEKVGGSIKDAAQELHISERQIRNRVPASERAVFRKKRKPIGVPSQKKRRR